MAADGGKAASASGKTPVEVAKKVTPGTGVVGKKVTPSTGIEEEKGNARYGCRSLAVVTPSR
jgi:hypothetical protein